MAVREKITPPEAFRRVGRGASMRYHATPCGGSCQPQGALNSAAPTSGSWRGATGTRPTLDGTSPFPRRRTFSHAYPRGHSMSATFVARLAFRCSSSGSSKPASSSRASRASRSASMASPTLSPVQAHSAVLAGVGRDGGRVVSLAKGLPGRIEGVGAIPVAPLVGGEGDHGREMAAASGNALRATLGRMLRGGTETSTALYIK